MPRREIWFSLASLLMLAIPWVWHAIELRKAHSESSLNRLDWEAGCHWLSKGYPDRALPRLLATVRAWPISPEAQLWASRCLRLSGDSLAWDVHLSAAKSLGWPEPDVVIEAAMMNAQTGNVNAVRAILEREIRSRPELAGWIYDSLCRGCLATHRLNEVLGWSSRWTAQDPQAWRPWLYRGDAFQLGTSANSAAACYRKSLELEPDNFQAIVRLGTVLMIDGQFSEALTEFEKAGQEHPREPEVMVGLANCRLSLGKANEARAAIEELIARHPKHAAGYLLRATQARDEGRLVDALADLKQAESLSPNEIDLTQNLLVTLRQLKRLEEAASYQRKLDALRSKHDRLEKLSKQLGKEPDNVELRFQMASIYLEMGKDPEAGQWLASVLLLDPRHRETHRLLAEHHEKQGKPERAKYHRSMSSQP